jgi:endo-1,4-beta-D-glucanase Y
MAFALISADKQWGGKGTLEKSYREYALRQIELVKAFDIHATGIVKPGNHWGGPENLNLSYFSPAFYKIFGEYSEDKPFWDDVIDINYEALFNSLNEENGNHENGLPPAWSNIDGEPIVPYDGATSHFQTISARIPFRIAQHYCWYGDQRAKEYLNKINNFFTSIGHDKLTDGYNLDGTIRPEAAPPHSSMSAVVVGAAAVAAMADGSYPKFIDGAYNLVKTGKLLVRDTYYQLSWTGLTMAFMTGNYVDMTRQ